MTLTSITTTRELAHRRNDGLDIRLLWDSATDRVTVALHDAKTGDGFEVEVGPDERALDVFHHPFAYAAFRDAARERRSSPGSRRPHARPRRHRLDRALPGRARHPAAGRRRPRPQPGLDDRSTSTSSTPTAARSGSAAARSPRPLFARRFDRIF